MTRLARHPAAPQAGGPALNEPPRSRCEAALDVAATALVHARRVIVSAVRANASIGDSEQHVAVVDIDRALGRIAELRKGSKP